MFSQHYRLQSVKYFQNHVFFKVIIAIYYIITLKYILPFRPFVLRLNCTKYMLNVMTCHLQTLVVAFV